VRAPAALAAEATGCVAADRDRRRVAAVLGDGTVTVLDAVTLSPEVSFEVDPPPHGLAFAPDGRALHAWSHRAWTALDLRDGATHVVAELPSTHRGRAARYGDGDVSPDGRLGALSLEATPGGVQEWLRVDLARGLAGWVGSAREGAFLGARFSDDGRLVSGLRIEQGGDPVRAPALLRCDAADGAAVEEIALLPPGADVPVQRRDPFEAFVGPRGAFALALTGDGDATRRLRVVRPGGAAATSAWLMGAVVLAISATRVAVYEGRRGRHGSLSVLDVEALTAIASAPWFDEDPPRGACFVGDDALAVVCGDGRVVRVEIDAAR
jgi:hypothetical protein